ncbi:hypothetical protein [uncultured Clostridium sp.]|uniref:hypothetical protein n=1 Tax=uncultured Clostridium sp. TaxID=59620 RepID=UPI002616DCDA|nr:hypothetical protein [uncultured Clostridium sp.]
MSLFPKYNFNDPNLDYSAVETTVKQMYASIRFNGGRCCITTIIRDALSDADTFLQCIVIDTFDIVRYQASVQSAYEILYILT